MQLKLSLPQFDQANRPHSRSAFGLGEATVDADGVALAAIQGLNQKLEQKQTEITELKQKNDSLENRLATLEKIILSQKPN